MLIKILLLTAIAVVVVLAVRVPGGARHLALRRMAVAGFAAFAALSVIFPDAWNAAAAVVGVGRGTDLLLYGLIIVVLVYMVTTYRRHREMEATLTRLARRIAIDETFTALGSADRAGGAPFSDPPALPYDRATTDGPQAGGQGAPPPAVRPTSDAGTDEAHR